LLAAVILSAGASSRMGRPKALIPFRGTTFLGHLIAVTRHPRIGVTRVVLGAGAEAIREGANLDPAMVVLNPAWEKGQLSSICSGIRSLVGLSTDGIVLCPVDHPIVSAQLVGDLVERFYSANQAVVLPTYNGRRGHPAIFSNALYSELLAASPDKGARSVVWEHAADVVEVPTDEEGIVLNINDSETLRRVMGAEAE
jgi:nicotine blue oxidoreductase